MATMNIADLKDKIKFYADKHGVPPQYLEGLLRAENSKDAASAAKITSVPVGLTSSAGAKGIMQITPSAVAQGVQDGRLDPNKKYDPFNIDDALDVGASYAAYGLKRSGGDPVGMASVYNSGRVNADNPETNLYRQKFSAAAGINQLDTSMGAQNSFAQGSSQDFASSLLSPAGGIAAMKSGLLESVGLEPAIQEAGQAAQEQAGRGIAGAEKAGVGQADINATIGSMMQQLQQQADLAPNSPTNQFATGLRASQQAHDQYEIERAKYDQMSQESFLDNPIGAILAAIELPHQSQVVNNLAAKQARAEDFTASRLSLLGAGQQTIKANTVTAQQQVDQAVAHSKADLAYAELARQQQGTLVQQADRALSRAHVAAGITGAEINDDLKQERLNQLQDKAQAEADMNEKLAYASTLLGFQKPVTTKDLTLMRGPSKEFFENLINTGTYGSDMYSAVRNYLGFAGPNSGNIASTGGAKALETANQMYRALDTQFKQPANQKLLAAGGAKNPEMLYKEAGQMYKDTIESSLVPDGTTVNDLSSPRWDATYNPYVLDFAGITNLLQKTQGNGLGTPISPDNVMYKYLQTRMAQGNLYKGKFTAEDVKGVYSAIQQDVQEGKLDVRKASADISSLVATGMKWQQSLQQLPRFGMKNITEYNASMPGMQESTDLTNRMAVENYLTKAVVGRNAAKAGMFNRFPSRDSFDFSVFNVPMAP